MANPTFAYLQRKIRGLRVMKLRASENLANAKERHRQMNTAQTEQTLSSMEERYKSVCDELESTLRRRAP